MAHAGAVSKPETPAADKVKYWLGQLEMSRKVRGFDKWQTLAKKIVKRYRDDRTDQDGSGAPGGDVTQGARFNILWSNVQTLMPALLGKTPKPVVERRYLDRDDVGRTASVILERALMYELDEGHYTNSLRKAVLDRLLPGRGVVWVRYEPKFTPMPGKTQEAKQDSAAHEAAETPAEESAEHSPYAQTDRENERPDEPQEATSDAPQEQVADESTIVDYIDWQDFMTSPARTWEEVWWVAKRVYMTRNELVKRFGKIGSVIPLDWSPIETNKSAPAADPDATADERRAKVWEFWDKTTRKVCWIAESYKENVLDEQDDPLHLECFWPVPKPLYATVSNNSIVPVPDYHEYQDQALELDDLTARIGALVKTIKVAGIYDASIPELGRIFQEGKENELVPTSQMGEFSAKAGPDGMGAIWLVDLQKQVMALKELYMARDQTKQVLYEITGISDIVRGQATSGSATATEQRIKGQFASMRLNDMQSEVARFARETLRIMGEIIAEQFDPMTLFLISGFEQYAKEQWPPEPPTMMPPMMGHNGGPPMDLPPGAAPPNPVQGAMPGGASPPAGPLPPEVVARQKAADMFKRAVELLRNDKLRGFRIDIEVDSLVEPDQQQMQQSRTELLQAIAQFLPQAIQAGAAMPELKPLLARLLMFFIRGFKASRDIESAFEQFIDDLTKDASKPKPPPPPSPEQIKAQAEIQKQQMENQRAQEEAQRDAQAGQMEMQMMQAKHQMELEKMQAEMAIKREELNLKREELAMKAQEMQMDAAIKERQVQVDVEATERKAQIDAENMDRQMQAGERKHELGMEVMEAKAKEAKKPKAKESA